MRSILVLAAVLVGLGALMAQMADRVTSPSASASPVTSAAVQPKTVAMVTSGRSVRVGRGDRGHYQVTARIDGTDLAFMVDTGATVIALREKDAARVGIRPLRTDFTVNVATANGNVKAAAARLKRVDVGGLIVDNVSALVLPDSALSENLLGMSYLSKLKRFEFADDRLVLEQ